MSLWERMRNWICVCVCGWSLHFTVQYSAVFICNGTILVEMLLWQWGSRTMWNTHTHTESWCMKSGRATFCSSRWTWILNVRCIIYTKVLLPKIREQGSSVSRYTNVEPLLQQSIIYILMDSGKNSFTCLSVLFGLFTLDNMQGSMCCLCSGRPNQTPQRAGSLPPGVIRPYKPFEHRPFPVFWWHHKTEPASQMYAG